MGQSNSPSENYLFLNVVINFVIVNQKLTGSALHIEKNQTIEWRQHSDMTISVDWDVKHQFKQTNSNKTVGSICMNVVIRQQTVKICR